MKYVLVTVSSGIIDQALHFDDPSDAIAALCRYVKKMNPEKEDAAVYRPDGMIANAKDFLDEEENFIDNRSEILARIPKSDKPIYIIGNPFHVLGFMVTSPDDPLGYKDPVEALTDLGQLRQDRCAHFKLYQVIPVDHPIAYKKNLALHLQECEIEDFDPATVQEYLKDPA